MPIPTLMKQPLQRGTIPSPLPLAIIVFLQLPTNISVSVNLKRIVIIFGASSQKSEEQTDSKHRLYI
ncbi:hypothetical protein XELAEV_18034446mg [Xenopus laevis]|uniref:Uncharacterized protein n=1 Tax=Xenopus laevis TaxID=8355 RepID=A0A974CE15_XENLA|nr:hypothetical protein XELAEV_18034446mg [Xenopus laevis]